MGTRVFRQDCGDVVGWTDVDGYTCDTYVNSQWCLSDGNFGAGWNPGWGTFATYALDGIASNDACCGCGGGTALTTPTPGTTVEGAVCKDSPETWTDIDGFDCAGWVMNSWCAHA